MEPDKLDELMADAEGTPKSWQERLTDDAAEYVAAWENRVRETGKRPNMVTLEKQLREVFGVKVSRTTLSQHFRNLPDE